MTNQPEFNNLYRDMTYQVRTLLIGTVNTIIAILVLYVYPLDRFGILNEKTGEYNTVLNNIASSQVILIILTILLGIILNYYYLTVSEKLSQRSIFILHNIILINIIIASVIIELPYFSIIALSVYILATMYIGRLKDYEWIITSSIVLLNISLIIIWYAKWINNHSLDPIEIISTQILVFIAIIVLRKSYLQNNLVYNIPLLINVILTPMIKNSTNSIAFDLNLLLFGLFMVLNLVNVLLIDNKEITYVSIIFSTILLPLQYIINIIYHNSLFSVDIFNLNFNLNVFIYAIYISILTFVSIRKLEIVDEFIPFMIFIITLFFTFYISMPNSINQLVLSTGYIYISIFMGIRSKNVLSVPILQTIGLYVISLNPNNSADIQNITFILFVILLMIGGIKLKYIKRAFYTTIGSIGSFVMIAIIYRLFDKFDSTLFSTMDVFLLAIAIILPGLLLIKIDKVNDMAVIIVIQTILLYLFALIGPNEIFDISILGVLLSLFSLELLLTSIKFKDKYSSLLITSIPPSALIIFYVLTFYSIIPYQVPFILVAILMILPSIIMFNSTNIDYKSISITIQGFAIASLTSLSNIYIWGFVNLISILYLAIIVIGVISWYKTRDNSSIIILGLVSLILQIWFVVTSSIHIPEYYVLATIILLLTSVIYSMDDYQMKLYIAYTQAISIFFFGYYTNNLTAMNLQRLIFIPITSLVFIGFVAIIIISTLKKKDNSVLTTIVPLSLMYSFFGLNSSISQIPPSLIISVVAGVYIILYFKSSIKSVYSYIFGAISVYLLTLQENQLAIIINSINIGIVSLMYILISFILLQTWRKDQTIGVYSGISLAIMNLFIILNGTLIPIEIITLIILLSSIIPLKSTVDRYTRGAIIAYAVLIISLLINGSIIQSILTVDLTVLNTILFISYCSTTIVLLLKTDDYFTWIFSLFLYTVMIFVNSVNIGITHPISIGISILMLSYLSYKSSYHRVRELIPAVQAFTLLMLLINDLISNSAISYTSIFTMIWVSMTLLIWYFKGTSRQLATSYLSIYTLIAIFNILSNIAGRFIVDELLLILILLSVTIFTIVFYSNLSRLNSNHLLLMLITTGITLILFSQNIRYLSSNVLIYRLILDWLIFLPVLVESSLFIKKYVQMMDNIEQGEKLIVTVQISFVIVALFMGAQGIYSLKLLAIAISFWIFTTMFTRKYLSWATSINTIFTLSFVLAQTPSSGDNSEIFYFIILSIFGIIMVILALINETKYHGEPLTASLVMTGAVFTAITILAPLLRGNSFPTDLIDLNTGNQIINFLPNIVWAIQGLGLFIFSLRYSKDYLRKFALSILLIDIFKTAMDIFSLDNIFIRSFGSFVLGLVLILIFYLFTNDDIIVETES